MRNKVSTGWATVEDGLINIADKPLRLPGIKVVKEVGRGANAIVFEAIDEYLDRTVAVKVWNKRGIKRAQFETAKIAKLNHPLIVATYQFQWVDGHPYSVMEFVTGSSGKVWLTGHPSIVARTMIWQMYSKSLHFIHNSGVIHGDPHLGNVLVFPDQNGIYGHETPYGEPGLSIKLADTGTSEFWFSRKKILSRESTLIFETAGRLFNDLNLDKLWFHPPSLSHQDTLKVLDALCEYVSKLYGFIDYDRASENAGQLVDLLLKTPLFELDEVDLQIRQTGYTTSSRFARRLNQRLLRIGYVMDASDIIDAETKRLYAISRQQFVDERVSAHA